MQYITSQAGILLRTSAQVTLLFLIITFMPLALKAESLFLKDGSIVEGKIRSEGDSGYEIVTPDKKTVTIKRSKVLRTTNDNAFKVKKYIKKKDGKTVEGYIVEESTDEYIVREKLNSPAEFAIEKAEVKAVSTEKFINRTTYYAYGFIPGVAQLYADRELEGGIFLGLFSCSVLFTGYAYYDYNKKHQDYLDIKRGSAAGDFDSAYDDYKTASYVFLGATVFTGVVYIANLVDVIFFAAPDFTNEQKSAETGDVFYNVAIGEPEGMNCVVDPYIGAAVHTAYDYSLLKVSAGVRF